MDERRRSFDEDINFFLNACPGPAVVKHGLHLVAYQAVPGIPASAASQEDDEGSESGRSGGWARMVGRRWVIEGICVQ